MEQKEMEMVTVCTPQLVCLVTLSHSQALIKVGGVSLGMRL